jgi:hypothetical protein
MLICLWQFEVVQLMEVDHETSFRGCASARHDMVEHSRFGYRSLLPASNPVHNRAFYIVRYEIIHSRKTLLVFDGRPNRTSAIGLTFSTVSVGRC